MPLIDIPKDARTGKEPCGECHLQEGETCDICGARHCDNRGMMDRDTIIKTLQAVLTDAASQVAISETCKAETTRAYAMGRQSALQFALDLMTKRTPLAADLAQIDDND